MQCCSNLKMGRGNKAEARIGKRIRNAIYYIEIILALLLRFWILI